MPKVCKICNQVIKSDESYKGDGTGWIHISHLITKKIFISKAAKGGKQR